MSPVVLPPVSTAYSSLSRAPPPDSVMYHPVGAAVLVVLPAVLESVLKFSVTAAPMVVRDTDPVPVSDGALMSCDLCPSAARENHAITPNAEISERDARIAPSGVKVI